MAALRTLVDGSEPHVETSPNGRYIRYSAILGRGAYKTVYKAFDTEEALEVAWNKLHVDRLSEHDLEKVSNEVLLLRQVEHKNIIHFYDTWRGCDSNGNQTINFITEQMMSGTLKEYLKKAKAIKLKVIRRWCRNILEAIAYLHSQAPPIMHRDLKCDNIFINGHVGEVKIGDLGLSGVKERDKAESVIGTPEFMAPELYEESYTEKVDIYAFGMCLLEIVTMEYPFSECNNMAQIFKKVFNGEKPKAFDVLVDGDFKEVVFACLQREANRPSAASLLEHPLFRDWEQDAGKESNLSLVTGAPDKIAKVFATTQSANAMPIGTEFIDWSDPLQRSVLVSIGEVADGEDQQVSVVAAKDSGGFYIGLEIPIRDAIKRVEFTFDPFEDSSQHIAQEMVSEFGLSDEQLGVIRAEIDRQVKTAKEQREAASRNATPQHPTRQPQIEQKPSIAHDSSTPTVSHISSAISPPHTAPGSLSHVQSISSTTSAPVSSVGHITTSTPALQSGAADALPPPPVDILRPASVSSVALETPSEPAQLSSQPDAIHATQPIQQQQLDQTQIAVSHQQSADVRPPPVTQHDMPTEHLPSSAEIGQAAAALQRDHPIEHVEHVDRVEHVERVEVVQQVQDPSASSGLQQTIGSVSVSSMGDKTVADLPLHEQHVPLASVESSQVQKPPPNMQHMGSISSVDAAAHAQSAHPVSEAPRPVKSTTEKSITKDGAYLEDAAVGNEEATRAVSSHDVSGSLNFESPPHAVKYVDDPRSSHLFPAAEQNTNESQSSLAVPRDYGQRIPGSRSEVLMSTHQRAGSDAELRYSPSMPHVPHSASDGQLRHPEPVGQHAVTELPPRPPSTPITPDSAQHVVSSGEHRSRSPQPVPQEGDVDVRASAQMGIAHEHQAPTYPSVSSGLAAVAAVQQNASARTGTPSTSIPTIVVVRPEASEVAIEGRQRRSNDASSPATDGSSESHRSIYSAPGSGEHTSKISLSTGRSASPQGRVSIVASATHPNEGKLGGRISPEQVMQSGHVRGSSWRSVQSIETTSSVTPKNRKHEEGPDPKSEKYLTKGLKLMDLCARGRYEDVKTALLNGASALFRDYDKRTPLHVCAGEGHGIVCGLLIESGAEISAKDRWGNTALSDAREKEHTEVVELLKRHGAEDPDVNIENLELLHYCARGDVEAVRHRITGAGKAAVTDYDNRTPLHLACSEGHVDIAEVLLVNGASPEAVDRKNRTPVDDAISNGRRGVLRLLKRYGAQVPSHLFQTDEEQAHHLGVELIEHCASGNVEEVKERLDYGANVNFRDYDHRTPLHLACIEGHAEIVSILVQVGAKLDARDRWGSTPLEDAVKAGFVSIVEKVREMELRRNESKMVDEGGLLRQVTTGTANAPATATTSTTSGKTSSISAITAPTTITTATTTPPVSTTTTEMNGHVEQRQIGDSMEFQQLPDGIAIPSINLSADDFAAKYPSNEESSGTNMDDGTVGAGGGGAGGGGAGGGGAGGSDVTGGVGVTATAGAAGVVTGSTGVEFAGMSSSDQREDEASVCARKELELRGGAIDGGAVVGMMNQSEMRFSPSSVSMSSISNSNGMDLSPVMRARPKSNAPPCPVKADIRSMVEGLFDAATRMS